MTFHQFYTQQYLERHAYLPCRLLHVMGPPVTLALVGVIIWLQDWWLLALAPVPSFLLAWLGHLLAHNRPTFFEHPVWSIWGYWKMIAAMVMGKY